MRKEGNETFMNTGNINFFEKFFMKMKFFFKKDNSELGEVISLSDILKCVVESIVYTLFIILIFYFLPYTKKLFWNLIYILWQLWWLLWLFDTGHIWDLLMH